MLISLLAHVERLRDTTPDLRPRGRSETHLQPLQKKCLPIRKGDQNKKGDLLLKYKITVSWEGDLGEDD